MTVDQSRRAARRAPSGGLWAEVLGRRRLHHDTAGAASREIRRPDQRGEWLSELFGAIAILDDAAAGRSEEDPREALVDLLAIGSSWVSAMDDRGIE